MLGNPESAAGAGGDLRRACELIAHGNVTVTADRSPLPGHGRRSPRGRPRRRLGARRRDAAPGHAPCRTAQLPRRAGRGRRAAPAGLPVRGHPRRARPGAAGRRRPAAGGRRRGAAARRRPGPGGRARGGRRDPARRRRTACRLVHRDRPGRRSCPVPTRSPRTATASGCGCPGRCSSARRSASCPPRAWSCGALQVPPSGQPTLFLADHPVTGGYPVIAVVVPSGPLTRGPGPPRPAHHLHPSADHPADRSTR